VAEVEVTGLAALVVTLGGLIATPAAVTVNP